jgi:MFS transporter, SP family, arabinose:H+ symporter
MKKNSTYIILVSLIVALGGFLMGFDASVISGVVKFIEPEFELSKIQLGWAVGCLTLSATIAMAIAGPLSDKYGRKKLLLWAAILYFISAIASALSFSFVMLVAARMIGGFGVGASLIIAPMYIAEISPAKLRGRMVSINQLNIVLGITVAFFTNYLILKFSQSETNWAEQLGFTEHTWRWMLGLEALPAILYFFSLFVVPRSPRWLVMHNRSEEARPILEKANEPGKCEEVLLSIQESIQKDKNREKASFSELFKPALKLVLLIGVIIAIVQQITGINSVFFYAPMIFEQTGIGTDSAFSQAVLVGLTNLVFTVLAILFIDKLGRKPLLAFGLSGITITMLLLAWGFNQATYTLTDSGIEKLSHVENYQNLQQIKDITYEGDLAFKAAIAEVLSEEAIVTHESVIIKEAITMNTLLILIGIIGFVASFAISLGPVMWVLFSELFPNRIRGIAISFAGFINSGVSFGVQLVFPWELANLGSAATFLLYGLFALAGLILLMMLLPETKGKTLEELEVILSKK